jgi:site-specific DNA-methyltransferase (adenine-specific)
MLDINLIYPIDCIDGLRRLDKNVISLTVTSPPYKDEDNYSEKLIKDVATELYRVHKDNSLCFVNFGHLAEDKFRPFRVCQIFQECGFKLSETFTWVKNHYKPIQGKTRVNNLTEFIFMLSKGNVPPLDRLSIGVPYKDKSNIGRFATSDLKCGGNVWYIPYETINSKEEKGHNDRFPPLLPEKCIRLANLKPEDIILDPFSGSGTTIVVAKKMKHNFIGFEIDENHYRYSVERLNHVGC